jgi:hypothetical protein
MSDGLAMAVGHKCIKTDGPQTTVEHTDNLNSTAHMLAVRHNYVMFDGLHVSHQI